MANPFLFLSKSIFLIYNLYMRNIKYFIGIDEVGRGPLAGPVTVAVVATTVNLKFKIQNAELKIKKKSANSKFLILNSKLAKLRDSKKLSPAQREKWFKWIKENKNLRYAVASVSPKVIDKINITKAANLAATRALKRLIQNSEFRIKNCRIYLDGGLYLNKISINQRNQHLSAVTIIKGDEKIPVIMLASIIAKVTRDRKMIRLHKEYPKYSFNEHKGYGTKRHIGAIRKYWPSEIHRLTFVKSYYKVKK